MKQARERTISRFKWLIAVAAGIYLWIGYSLVSNGDYTIMYSAYARAYEVPADWESHDVIYQVISAHYQDYADPRKEFVDNVYRTFYDTPRTMYLCVFGKRHGMDKPQNYQIRLPMQVRNTGDTHWRPLVSNAYFLPPDFVDEDCEANFRDDVVEVQVQPAGTISRSNKFGAATGNDSHLDLVAELRNQGFHIPSRYPSDGVPFVFVYSLENAQHRTPLTPPDYPTLLDWPTEYKHVYVGYYERGNKSWRVAGIIHDTGNHRPPGVKGFLLKFADATVAPLYLCLGLLVNLFGVKFG